MDQGTSAQKMRLMAGILQEYPTYPLTDFAVFHKDGAMLLLVIPKMANQVQDELSKPYRSKCGLYSLTQCINLILEYGTPTVNSQLSYPESEITVNFLRVFDYNTRQIGK